MARTHPWRLSSQHCNKFHILSRPFAEKHLGRFVKDPHILISITDPDKPPAALPELQETIATLRLTFDDSVDNSESTRPMSLDDALAIKDFVLAHMDVPALVVHCEGGVSRSAACVAVIAEALGADSSFVFGSSVYSPNPRVLSLLRQAFSLKGAACA